MNTENQKERTSVSATGDMKDSVAIAGNDNPVVNVSKINGDHNIISITINQLFKARVFIPAFVIALILAFIGWHIIQKQPVTNVNITNTMSSPSKEEAKHGFNPFKSGIYGIIVAQFNGNTEEHKNKGKEVQGTIQGTLNARFKGLGINDAEARKLPTLIESHEEAREFGKKYKAELVIWGDVTLQGIIPNITIVNEKSEASMLMKPETAILKNSLCHAALANVNDICFPALTDEPTKLVSFVAALKYKEQKKYEKAIEYFTSSLHGQPTSYINSSVIFFYRGLVQYLMKEYLKAINDYTQAIMINREYDAAYNNRGVAYVKKDEHSKAIDDFNEAIRINPKDDMAYNNRGATYYYKGKYEKAINDFTQAIQINTKDDIAYNNRGNTYANNGRYDNAIDDYTQAIRINPKDEKTYNNRGNAYINKDEYGKAINDYTQAIRINSKYSGAYINKARLLSMCPNKRYRNGQKAVEYAKKAIKLDPNSAAIFNILAAAYAEKRNFEDAVKTQERAIEMLSDKDKSKYISEYMKHLNSYKAKKPWREKPKSVKCE